MMSPVDTKAESRHVGGTIASAVTSVRGILPHPRHRRAIVAILVTYALLWQALLACVTTTDWLAPTSLALSASICASGPEDHQQPTAPSNHGHGGCCVLCMTPGLAGSDADVSKIVLPRIAVTPRKEPFEGAAAPRAASANPCQPRAPPTLA